MIAFRRAGRALLVLWVVGCGANIVSTDGSTNWLSPCYAAPDCTPGLQCICGACTAPCDESASCSRFNRRATCVEAAAVPALCSLGHAPGRPVCAMECRSSDDCLRHRACVNGLCAFTSVESADASIEGGGNGGIEGGSDGSIDGSVDAGSATSPTDASATELPDAEAGVADTRTVAGGSTGSGGSSGIAIDASTREEAGVVDLKPVAVSASNWGWQGSQRSVRRGDGTLCAARIAIAVGEQGACFEDASDTLVCAGTIAAHSYGGQFTSAGVGHVDQVQIGQFAPDDGFCVHVGGGAVECMGSANANSWGQLGNGTLGATDVFTPWGARSDLVAFGTGTWDVLCALSNAGSVYCAGETYGTTPVLTGAAGGHSKFWLPTGDFQPHIDDTSLFRPSEE